MKAQCYSSLGLAVLSSALVLLCGRNVVATTSSSAPSSNCTDLSTSDGDCDLSNNTEECGYDGGDCCECTCVSTTEYVCGVRSGFSCLDPSASCFVNDGNNDDDATTLPDSDGIPNLSPTPTVTTTSTEEPSSITSAQDTATAAPTRESSTLASSCVLDSLSDGACDSDNNNKECGYDGGDCCKCTCISSAANGCGSGTGFACVDPDASSSCFVNGDGDDDGDDDAIVLLPASDDSAQQTSPPSSTSTSAEESSAATPADGNSTTASSCIPDSLSDGNCDVDNNNEECGFDGGDCCECTCESTSAFTCGDNDGYDCVDPSSSCEELSVESRNSANRTAQTFSPVYLQLAMFTFVLSLQWISQWY